MRRPRTAADAAAELREESCPSAPSASGLAWLRASQRAVVLLDVFAVLGRDFARPVHHDLAAGGLAERLAELELERAQPLDHLGAERFLGARVRECQRAADIALQLPNGA